MGRGGKGLFGCNWERKVKGRVVLSVYGFGNEGFKWSANLTHWDRDLEMNLNQGSGSMDTTDGHACHAYTTVMTDGGEGLMNAGVLSLWPYELSTKGRLVSDGLTSLGQLAEE